MPSTLFLFPVVLAFPFVERARRKNSGCGGRVVQNDAMPAASRRAPFDVARARPARLGGPRIELLCAIAGSLAVALSLTIIWIARASVRRDLYVSELGAAGEPTARWFQTALLLVVFGGSLIAFAARRIRSAAPLLRAWTPAVSLWVGCGFFLIASQVTCTAHCPLPVGPTFTWQDFTHTTVAVLAFSAACWAMLQVSFLSGNRMLARASLASGLAVAVVAGTGGILSLARFQAGFGSRLELVATTIAIGWLIVLGAVVARSSVAPGASYGRNAALGAAESGTSRNEVEKRLSGELERAARAPGSQVRPAGRSRSRRARSSGIPAPD